MVLTYRFPVWFQLQTRRALKLSFLLMSCLLFWPAALVGLAAWAIWGLCRKDPEVPTPSKPSGEMTEPASQLVAFLGLISL